MIEIIGFAGSLREASYNRGLIRAAAELAPEGMRIHCYDLKDIPLFNGDVEAEGVPPAVDDFKKAIEGSAGLLIATPENQHGIPGVLKNALDWASRPAGRSSLKEKPAAIMGATLADGVPSAPRCNSGRCWPRTPAQWS